MAGINLLYDCDIRNEKIRNNPIRKEINKIITIDDPNIDAHPGIARLVVILIMKIAASPKRDAPIARQEAMSKRMAMISIKTARAPIPWNTKEVKLIFEVPVYRVPFLVGTMQ